MDKSTLSIGMVIAHMTLKALIILVKSFGKKQRWNKQLFEGIMYFRTIPRTLLQMFCKIGPDSKVIVKNINYPDENPRETLKHE